MTDGNRVTSIRALKIKHGGPGDLEIHLLLVVLAGALSPLLRSRNEVAGSLHCFGDQSCSENPYGAHS